MSDTSQTQSESQMSHRSRTTDASALDSRQTMSPSEKSESVLNRAATDMAKSPEPSAPSTKQQPPRRRGARGENCLIFWY